MLDLIFFKIDYGNTKDVTGGLGYLGYYLVLYSPIFLPFLVCYNYVINALLNKKKHRWFRYGIAIVLGLLIGLQIRRGGISFCIGAYRPLKNVLLFALIMLSLEITRDLTLSFRDRKIKKEIENNLV